MVTRKRLVLSLGIVLVATLPLPADAAVTRGVRAPELDARDVATNRNVLLSPLRGRMVLLEFFGTACPHCQRSAPRMNAIHDRYRARGLVVVGLSPDSRDELLRFRGRFGVRHALAQAPMDTLREYGVGTYPLGFLISPDGRVLWRGKLERLTNRVIEAYLGRVQILPTTPPTFPLVRDALRHGRYGEAERSLARLRSCTGIDESSCSFVLRTLAWIEWHKQRGFANAAQDVQRGQWFDAYQTYRELEAAYLGDEAASKAAAERTSLLADPRRQRDVQAWSALSEARRLGRWQSPARVAELLTPVINRFAGTGAAMEASRLLPQRQ